MTSKKNKIGSNQDLYRICPSQLTKHELEDLYFTVLETNIQLRKTINEQQDKIKTLSKITQTKTSAMKVLQAEDRNNCCVFTNIKVKQQKECLDHLKRAHEKTAEKIRKLNTQVCSTNQNSRFSPYCAQNNKCIKNVTSAATSNKYQCNSAQSGAKTEEIHKMSVTQHQCNLANKDAQTHEINQKLFHSVGTQTELPRDASLQHTQTQTEQLKDGRLRSADTQTNMPRSKTFNSVGTQTEQLRRLEIICHPNSDHFDRLRDHLQTTEIQTELQQKKAEAFTNTENSSPQDYIYGNSVQTLTQTETPKRKLSLVSVETQIESISEITNKNHDKDCQEGTLCDENRCRTLMDELKLKITYLVEELAQTNKKYSDRISRLEFGVQEFRRESMEGGHKRMVERQEVSLPSESYLNKLVNNLKDSTAYSADLEMQLSTQKKKVSELVTQLRFAQLQNQLTQEQQLINKKRMLNREEIEGDAQQEGYSWICNCSPNCPNNQCPFRNKPSYKHECTSTYYSANNTPASSMSSTDKTYNFSDRKNNNTCDLHKDQALARTRKSQNVPDLNNKQYLTNNYENKNMTNYSKRISNGNNRKEIAVPLSAEPNITKDTKNQDFNSPETFGANENYNVDIQEKTNTQMQTEPVAGVRYSDDVNHNRAEDIFDVNKAYGVSDYNKNKKLSINDRDGNLDSQNGTITATDNQSKDSNMDGKRKSQEKADINKLNVNVDANGTPNSVDPNKQQFLSKKRNISVSSNTFQNRDVASPSLLVKSLKSINEEQTKTVAELRRQQNTSQKPSGKTETAQNEIPNVNNNESNGNILLDTIGLMRALSTLALNKAGQKGDKKESTDDRSQNDNAKIPQSANLDSDLNPESSKYRTVAGKYSTPEETMGLLRLASTIGENLRNNAIDREKTQKTSNEAELNTKVQVSKQETGTEPERNAQLQSIISENRYRYSDDSRCTFKGVNEVCKSITNIDVEGLKEQTKQDVQPKDIENVPTKDNENEKDFNKNKRRAVMNNEEIISRDSVNYSYQPDKGLLKQVINIDKESQVEISPEKEVRGNTVSSSAQREIATYRRNSGTLCFKTVPASKRSQLCQCDEQSFCEIVKRTQTGSEIDNVSTDVQNCATGHIKCTLGPKNIKVQRASMNTVMSGSIGKRSSKQYDEDKFVSNSQSLTNYLNSRDETVQTRASPMQNEYFCDQRNSVRNSRNISTASGKSAKGPMLTLKEELERCKESNSNQNNLLGSRLEIQNSLDTKASEEVVADYDAGCQLKRGMAKHSVNEQYGPKCVFVLHIGTVVLSDEAVLISRGKSLGLTWKFYDQDIMTTQMRAGRVVVFDFSTEYDTPLTDDFMNYMKHDELKILICQLDEPNKPIASCSLPLRDALLNTNRRADMSLALVAGPQIIYARKLNHVSDVLDAGDEMGVLDLWCMLRADAQFVPLINKAISRRSKPTLLSQEPKISDPKGKEKQLDRTQMKQSKTLDKKLQQNDEYPSLHRWGSSVLRLPSRQQSQESSDKMKQENSSEVTLSDRRRDSSGFKMPSTVEIDKVIPKKKLTMSQSPEKMPKAKPKKTSSKTTSAAVQYNEDPESLIVDEVFANIRTSDDMKRVMNRINPHAETGFSDSELSSYKKQGRPSQKDLPVQRLHGHHASVDMSSTTFLSNAMEDQTSKKTKKVDTGSTMSQDLSLEPTILFPRGSLTSKRSDITDINRKYDNIAKLYAKYNAQKNDGSRADLSKKQVKINSKRASKVEQKPRKDKLEEEEPTIDITVLWLALNEECEAMLNPRVQRVYVSYEFLGNSGADLETPVSLPKPKHYVDKCYFNFKKTFQIDKKDMTKLGEMARCRATSRVSKTDKDCIVFSVISEPPEDPLGLDICEDIGFAYLYLGDLLAYGIGSSGYTEVIPVRSLSGTSVCGVLAVRLDGLDLLRRCLELVDSQISHS